MLRTYRASRATLIPVIQLLSLVIVFALPVVWGAHVYTSTPSRYDRVTVRQGDTVWSIVAKRAGPGSDVAEAAYTVAQVNHLTAKSRLQPGQVLLIPR
ncbi:MAG TPA: LysM peptidoglycan-binding domain-containing protein [Candidatus Eremiobacteraceae bacterium]